MNKDKLLLCRFAVIRETVDYYLNPGCLLWDENKDPGILRDCLEDHRFTLVLLMPNRDVAFDFIRLLETDCYLGLICFVKPDCYWVFGRFVPRLKSYTASEHQVEISLHPLLMPGEKYRDIIRLVSIDNPDRIRFTPKESAGCAISFRQ